MKFYLEFPSKPIEHTELKATLKTAGVFSLVATKQKSTRITGKVREELGKRLTKGKESSSNVFLSDLSHQPGLSILHGAVAYKNTTTLRRIKSDYSKKLRGHENVYDAVCALEEKFKTSHFPKSKVPGYIQDLNPSPVNFKVILYDEGSIKMLNNYIDRGVVTFSTT